MKYSKIIFVVIPFVLFANSVIAEKQRIRANPDVSVEVRSTEDIVNDSSMFTSINSSDNAVKMSSASSSAKNKTVALQLTGIVQVQQDNKDVMKKYNRSSSKRGEKKNK